MKCFAFFTFALCIIVCCPLPLFSQDNTSPLLYRSHVTDTIFNKAVPDPYRWMESLNSDSVHDWLKVQKKITAKEKERISNAYIGVYDNIYINSGSLVNYVEKSGPYYFTMGVYNPNQAPALYYRKDFEGPTAKAFDPNEYSLKDVYVINGYAASADGKYIAAGLSKAGSDWVEIRVRNLIKGSYCPDKLQWAKSGEVIWWGDGFFYRRYKAGSKEAMHMEANTHEQVCYHTLGQNQDADKVIYNIPPATNSSFSISLSSDMRYLLITAAIKSNGGEKRIFAYKDLNEGVLSEFKSFLSVPENELISYRFIDEIEGKFAILTNYGAPNYKVVLFDKDSLNHGTDFIRAYKQSRLRDMYSFGHKLVGLYFNNDGTYSLAIFTHDSKVAFTANFDTGVIVKGFYGSPTGDEVIFYKHSFYTPIVAYTLNMKTNTIELLKNTRVNYEATLYTTTLVNYKSKDGTDIPMYLTYKKGLKLNGQNPVLLYGYGGFGASTDPFYSFNNVIFCASGGILAVPLIRGGDDFGPAWHIAGVRLNKQNSFDDFIAAAEYLINNGYTNPNRLAIRGVSNGGLLVGAVLVQRPELFKVAVATAGIFDMTRFHLFTGGAFWQNEYGTPGNEQDFKNLLAYSPVHNVKNGVVYPAVLLVTGKNDDRVPPFNSFKFLAQLQEKSAGANPHIMYFEEESGHNGANSYEDYVRQRAFEMAFILKQLKADVRAAD